MGYSQVCPFRHAGFVAFPKHKQFQRVFKLPMQDPERWHWREWCRAPF